MRVKNRTFALVVILIVMFSFSIGAQEQERYIKDEKLIGVGTQCSTDSFEEVGNFSDYDGNLVRHCVQKSTQSTSSTTNYVISSYFERDVGQNDCLYGGIASGSFIGLFNSQRASVNLCVYRIAGSEINFADMGIKNVTIKSSCPTGYYNTDSTGIDVLVSGGGVMHCALGGHAGDVIRDRCEGFSGFINEISSECNYNLNVPGTGSSIGEVLNGATLQEGPADTCPNINCTCMERGFSLTNGWNCTAINEVIIEPPTDECLFSNLKWKDGEGKNDISNVPEKEEVLMFAEVSDVCELEREIECAVYKYQEFFQDAEHPQGHANGEVTQKDGGTKRAYCVWDASKLPGTEEDTDQQYYFKMWFANNVTYKVKSENIEILNETIIELPPQPITINWSTSRWQKRDEPCPEDNFVVKITGNKMWCAEFIKSDGGEIFWGERRKVEKIRGTKPCGLFNLAKCPAISCSILGNCEKLECEDNEAAIQSKNEYKLECAIMEDEEGTLVEMGEVKSRRNNGCGKDGVVVAAKRDIEYCAIGLVLGGEGSSEPEEPDEETSGAGSGSGIGGQGGGFMQGGMDLIISLLPMLLQFFI